MIPAHRLPETVGTISIELSTTRIFGELEVARGDGRYADLMSTIAKSHLLIIDDWGLSTLNDREQRDILEILMEVSDEGI